MTPVIRYSPGKRLRMHGADWEVIEHRGEFDTVVQRTRDGERRTLSNMAIVYAVAEERGDKTNQRQRQRQETRP